MGRRGPDGFGYHQGVEELAEGTIFAGEYRVVRRLATGGMGVVYVAEQLSTGRQRALKLMHVGMAGSPELREKFTLEARVGARIASEHVVEVVGAGVDVASGAPWLAMELLVGEDLLATVEQHGAFTLPEAAAILGQVCHALGAAHAAGVVHRDLKPENVFLARSKRAQEAYTVKVLDFGIAKVLEEARANTGAIGSPLWMAPEQAERDAPITPATDVWALGLLAFHMCTGRCFWLAAKGGELAVRGFLRELVLDPIPSASARAAELGSDAVIAPELDAWFARTVARDPSQRYGDAAEAYAALCTLCGFALPPAHAESKRPSLSDGRSRSDLGSIPTSASVASVSAASAFPASDPPPRPRAPEPPEPAGPPGSSLDPGAVLPVSGLPSGRAALVALGLGVAALTGYLAWRGSGSADVAPVKGEGEGSGVLPYCPKGMVRVPASEATVGSDAGPREEQPAHPEHVGALCMDVTEVTAGEYRKCVRQKGCRGGHAEVDWPGITREEREAWSPFCNEGREGTLEHPMNCVSFEDAVAYCRWVDKRLPTEAQWEVVARGRDGRPYPWGHEPPSPARVNACDDGCARVARGALETVAARLAGDDRWESTSPTGAFPAGVGPFGTFDMAGNVAEWVDAPFCNYGEQACGTADRVVRGGSWMTSSPAGLRATSRAKASPATRLPDVGFRCVK